jgi:hypothetical protein
VAFDPAGDELENFRVDRLAHRTAVGPRPGRGGVGPEQVAEVAGHVAFERALDEAADRCHVLRLAAARVHAGEAAAMTPEEHSRAFMAYVAGLLADFDRYLAAGTPDLGRDGAGYTVAGLYLTDAELTGFLRDLAAIVQPLLANAPGKGRRRRMLYTIFLPEPDSRSAARTHEH